MNSDYTITIKTLFANQAPVFKNPLAIETVTVGINDSWPLPAVSDPDGDQIASVTVKLGGYKWVNFIPQAMMFFIDGKLLTNSDAMVYNF